MFRQGKAGPDPVMMNMTGVTYRCKWYKNQQEKRRISVLREWNVKPRPVKIRKRQQVLLSLCRNIVVLGLLSSDLGVGLTVVFSLCFLCTGCSVGDGHRDLREWSPKWGTILDCW
jgi:hypothetical protein